MRRYNNYHKHTHKSFLSTDSNSKCIDYINRAKELGEINYFTTEHGTGGDIFEADTLCTANNIHAKFGMEGYIVPDPKEKDRSNYHIVLIPATNEARKKLNLASSRANEEGYYYRPRLFLDDLVNNFDSKELYITTACVGGLLRDGTSIKEIFMPLYEKFGKNLMLEVQSHDVEIQKEINTRALKLSKKLGLYLIAANDSHYIYPEDAVIREELLKGKGQNYPEEEGFILDYPSYDVFAERFSKQGILSPGQIADAIDTTLIFDSCEDIEISRAVKMPTIYPDLTDDEKIRELKRIIKADFPKMVAHDSIPKEIQPQYAGEIKKEMKVIEETTAVHSADYFLLNYNLMHLAIDKYGGILTRTGRGSCGAYLINKVLGITQIDRLATGLPIYSERFMSTARLLENKAMPDIDYNIVDQEPFVKASRELLGEHGCYPMLAYGTMKESEAFRNVCRSKGLEFSEFNDVAKDVGAHRDDPEWAEYIEEAQIYLNTVVSVSPHSCAHVLSNDDIRREIGIVRIGDGKGKPPKLCALITSEEADAYKYLKNDYLVVTVWNIISSVFKELGMPIMSVRDLVDSLDDKVWELFDNGITATLNQIDGAWATELVKKYKPRSVEELSQFVACIRPSFNSFRDKFIARKPYTTGSAQLDNILQSTNHYVLFQENLMQYFEWLGVTPAESISLIKKISKKKIKQSDFDQLTERIRKKWVENTGSIDMFEETWADMQSMMNYGFNSPHGMAYALDCLYCAYLKAHYPLEYYTTVLNMYEKSDSKTTRLTAELEYFGITLSPIKFRYSQPNYSYDKETRAIYKGLSSIKYLNKRISRELYSLRDRQFQDFYELLRVLTIETSVDTRQLEILIKLNFFSEFGNPNQLMYQSKIFMDYFKEHGSLQLNKDKATTEEVMATMLCEHDETEKLYRIPDRMEFIRCFGQGENIKTSVKDLIRYESEYLGYINIKIPKLTMDYAFVMDVNNKYANRIVTLYRLNNGEIERVKVKKQVYESKPILEGMIIRTTEASQERRWKRNPDGSFTRIDEYETILKKWCEVK